MVTNIDPRLVRYIKLGQGGGWEAECIADGIIRFGFSTARGDQFAMSSAGRWANLTASFIAEGRGPGTATRFTNEVKLFFEDEGRTLWLTFHGASLYWGFLTREPAERHPDGDGTFRRVDDGWKNHDLLGEPLTTDRLSGALTKLAAYRGTSCGVDVADYAVRRINGQKVPEVESAISAVAAMRRAPLTSCDNSGRETSRRSSISSSPAAAGNARVSLARRRRRSTSTCSCRRRATALSSR